MSYRNRLDQHSELFHHNWTRPGRTRPKRSKSQVNGHTEMSQTNIILRSNAKAHRW
ncbi:YpzG family protein [Bacillus subtilis]|uniref:YpzG family protein n=1 Tax=Bacillus subtilis TaxID=1423 RepID=UPI00227F1017|nr:YpzG family protein [Bacillus subtilis]MCY8209158.1 YpzG family protein [Bacillus subtilis]